MSDSLELLNTLYDDVIDAGNGIFGVKLGDCFGLCKKDVGTLADPIYKTAAYRNYYSVLYLNRQLLDTHDIKSDVPIIGTIIFHNNIDKSIKIHLGESIKEHSSTGFKVLEIRCENLITLYNAVTGEKVCTSKAATQRRFRGSQYIMLGYPETVDGKDIMMGVTQDFKVDTVENLLKDKYKQITFDKKSKRYITTDENGRKIKFNVQGQQY